MDPLAALSLAGTVLQFAQFAGDLLNSTRRIYNSASGLSNHAQNLNDVYQTLSELGVALQSGQGPGPSLLAAHPGLLNKHHVALRSLAVSCSESCDQLMTILGELKAKANKSRPSKWWSSFRKALSEVAKQDEIKSLKARIDNNQLAIITHLCAISKESIGSLESQFRSLEKSVTSWHSTRSQELGILRETLFQLHHKVDAITSRPDRQPLSESDIEDLTARVSDLSVTGQVYLKEHDILASLDFDQRTARHGSIPEAHRVTLQWLFKRDEDNGNPEHRFMRWLECGSGVFWVSGKPGSGKSTLMKYAADHPDTPKALLEWGSGKQVVLASHYFWAPGTEIQKSSDGLLRTLLYDILARIPDLLPVICAGRWQGQAGDGLRKQPWSGSELRQALRSLASQQKITTKFCFFIDGLDEYGGDHLDLCNDLLALAESGHIKLCLSSRPWNVFEDSFGKSAENMLYVHELTRQDIYNYAERRLRDHSQLQALPGSDHFTLSLIKDITDRSQGVFLWVFLVTKQLREGLTNGDSLGDLRARLDAIPTDLDRFFRQILESVDPFYHTKMAETLRIALDPNVLLQTIMLAVQDLEYEDDKYYLKPLRTFFPPDNDGTLNVEAIHNRIRRQLSGRCKGLLEDERGQVHFIHRTVKDFLETPEMEEFLVSRSRPEFVRCQSVAHMLVALLKAGSEYYQTIMKNEWKRKPHTFGRWPLSRDMFADSLITYLSYQLEQAGVKADLSGWIGELLDELENYFRARTTSAKEESQTEQHYLHGQGIINLGSDIGWWLSLVLWKGPSGYVLNKVREGRSGFAALGDVLFPECGDLTARIVYSVLWTPTRLKALRHLLALGKDPNEKLLGSHETGPHITTWSRFVQYSTSTVRDTQGKCFSTIFCDALCVLLDHGADPNASLYDESSPHKDQLAWPPILAGETAWVRILETAFVKVEDIPLMNKDCYQSFLAVIKRLNPARTNLTALTTVSHNSETCWKRIRESIIWRPISWGKPGDGNDEKRTAYINFILGVVSQLAVWDEEATLPWGDLEEPLGKVSHLAEIPTEIQEVMQRRRQNLCHELEGDANLKRPRESDDISSATSAAPRKKYARGSKS